MEWELSKENVLPRKNGRTVSQLVSALQPKGDHASQTRATKQQFEEELRTYQGNDPLDIWFRYITWMEETNPQGGKDLPSLLRSCLLTFSEVDRYKNDPRYVEIWVKFANLYDNPILLYEHMFGKGIGSQNAMFYESWASAYELLGNSKKADAIFSEGVRMKAEPFNYLQRRHYEFQSRTFIGMMKTASLTDKDSVDTIEAEGRAAFMSLKTNGKKTSAIRPHGPQPAKTDVRVPLLGKSQQLQSKFEIHTDENNPPSDGLPQCNEYESIPFKTKVNRENCRNPGPWPQNKMTPKKSLSVIKTAPFVVQNDDTGCLATPKHVPEIDSKALSVQKTKKEPVTPMDVINAAASGIKQLPMYCKEKVYAGVEEFSFEEIRALRWKRRHEEKMYLSLVEKNKKLKEEQQKILLRNEELLIQHQVLQKSLDENVEMKPVEPQEHSLKDVSSRDLTLNGSLNRSGQHTTSNSKTPEPLQNTSQTGFNSSFQNKEGPKSTYAPSTTLNTMEALEVVRGFYCDSINLGKDTTIDRDQDADYGESEPVYQEPVLKTAPFVICEDEQEPDPPAPVKNVNNVFISPSSNSNFKDGISTGSKDKGKNAEKDVKFHLTMPDVNEITLGFGNEWSSTFQKPVNPAPQPNTEPTFQIYEDDPQTCPINQVLCKNMVSTPFHPSTNVFSLPDMSNISLINGTACITTENTIMIERPTENMYRTAENTNRTTAMSPIKERSNEGTHSSLENRTADPSHHTNSHFSQVSSKQLLIADPFCKEHQKKVLANLSEPLEYHDSYHCLNEDLPILRTNFQVTIGLWRGVIEKQVAKGGNGQIYKLCTECTLAIDSGMFDVALKVMKFSNFWEFYICDEIQERLKKFPNASKMSPCYPVIKDAYFYNNGSILITPFYKYGTLLDFVNKKQAELCNSSTCEALAVYFLIELLTIVDRLHKCKIIHGDIKPDNIVIKLRKKISPDLKVPMLLTLIDFGEAIDMSTYPEGTVFQGKVMTSGFQCIEMKTDKPWSYQTDLFGILGTIHTVLFGKYMNVFYSQGKWLLTSNFQRKWNIPLWKQLFHDLLNIPSADQLPNLIELRDQFIEYFNSSLVAQFKMAMYTDMQ
ncbi:mitotic checkpoint serine/threonine-protein kinase BUB1 isoform X2 [Octopus bimaculoides]|uniref:mitotic checkpoint serine/threonine-protein kinase BUB1 isoform X2 n=1 Tax=Octopus bimaculoides TaxID=37653 RepID=UPI00071D3643|nr:mitotic checkpoint serine/threonine-protein kinase BUB1 isoform X2 [Octopus bimaculoides]|eukprot:XP_014768647.1 PREDICTED: mitotic checkpoint serine/threonine-protein kinase BUB1-like isoform X2 [Octopus bimaculoides]